MSINNLLKDAEEILSVAKKTDLSTNTTPKTVLLTGATGYVGGALLASLLYETTLEFYCLVRGDKTDQAFDKVKHNVEKYRPWQKAFNTRVTCICGDLTQPLFGLNENDFLRLSTITDTILHLAANVNFLATYNRFKNEVIEGTKAIISFSHTSKRKAIFYLSTYGVFDSHINKNRTVTEEDCPQSNGLMLGYTQAKWVTEYALRMLRDYGYTINIFRIGNIAGDHVTGYWNPNDFLPRLVQFVKNTGIALDLGRFTITPINYLVQCMTLVLTHPSLWNQNFHISRNDLYTSQDIFDWLKEFGLNFEVHNLESFSQALRNAPRTQDIRLIGSLLKNVYQKLSAHDWIHNEVCYSSTHTDGLLKPYGYKGVSKLSSENMSFYLSRMR